jgi:hypothetical protein
VNVVYSVPVPVARFETIFIFGFNAENFMKIRQGMTSGECVENKWFNMKYIGKYLSVEIL